MKRAIVVLLMAAVVAPVHAGELENLKAEADKQFDQTGYQGAASPSPVAARAPTSSPKGRGNYYSRDTFDEVSAKKEEAEPAKAGPHGTVTVVKKHKRRGNYIGGIMYAIFGAAAGLFFGGLTAGYDAYRDDKTSGFAKVFSVLKAFVIGQLTGWYTIGKACFDEATLH